MDYLAAAALGVVQGLTEFLPVSSSAHLILARAVFGWDADAFGMAFDVACHVGTLVAVVVYFRQDLLAMAAALARAASRPSAGDARRIRLIMLIGVGTIPIVIVGALFASAIERTVRSPLVAAWALVIGGVVLLIVERLVKPRGGEESLSLGGAFAIGVAQSAALVPGVSRSGATIATGMALGLQRAAAARFTFLMSLPAILAAAAREGLELRHAPLAGRDAVLFAIGAGTSALVGYVAIRYLIRYLVTHRLDLFAIYRVLVGAGALIWLATR